MRRTEGIGPNLREFTCANLPLKKDVNLSRTKTFGLWKPEVGPDKRDEAKSAPDEAALPTQIPRGGIEDGWIEEVGHDTGNIIAVAGDDYTLDTQTG